MNQWLIQRFEILSRYLENFELFSEDSLKAIYPQVALRWFNSLMGAIALWFLISVTALMMVVVLEMFKLDVLSYVLWSLWFALLLVPLASFKLQELLYKGYIKFLFLMHKTMPNPEARLNEIRESYAVIELLQQSYQELKSKNLLKEEYLGNRREFIKKYFKIKSANFNQFYEDRVINSNTGEVNQGYLYYSLLIPQKDKLSNDALRRCLQDYPEIGLEFSQPLDGATFEKLRNSIEFMFSDYSPEQVERIFTNFQGKIYFHELIHYTEQKLPVAKNFQELYSLLREKELPKWVKALHGVEDNDLRVKVLLTKLDYEEASLRFRNCVRHYYDHKEVFLLTFYTGHTPEACVSIQNQKIKEIKGVGNSSMFREKDVRSILKDRGLK